MPKWPVMREDGSITVAIRFMTTRPDAEQVLAQLVAAWMSERQVAGADVLADLRSAPRVEVPGPETVDVVLDARPNSRLWKDWLVSLAHAIGVSRAGLAPASFVDLVGGVERPALPAE